MDSIIFTSFIIVLYLPAYRSTLYFVTQVSPWEDASRFCSTQLGGSVVGYGSEILDFIESCSLRNYKVWLGKPWPEYLGCKIEKLPLRIKTNIQENEMLECLKFCGVSSQLGVQRKTCKCFSKTTTFGRNTDCTTICPGNLGETCGGFRSMDTYRIVDTLENSQCQSLFYVNPQEYRLQPQACNQQMTFVCKDNRKDQANVCDYTIPTTILETTSVPTTYQVTETSEATRPPPQLAEATTTNYSQPEANISTSTSDSTHYTTEDATITTMTSISTENSTITAVTSISTDISTNETSTQNQTTFRPPVSIQESLDWLMFLMIGITATLLILVLVYFCIVKQRRPSQSSPEDKTDFEIVNLSVVEKYADDMKNQDKDEPVEKRESKKMRKRISSRFRKMSRNLSMVHQDNIGQQDAIEFGSKSSLPECDQIRNKVTKRSIRGRQYLSQGEFASVYFKQRPVESQPLENIRYMSTQFGADYCIKSFYAQIENPESNANANPRTIGCTSTFKPDRTDSRPKTDSTITQPERSSKPIVTIKKNIN